MREVPSRIRNGESASVRPTSGSTVIRPAVAGTGVPHPRVADRAAGLEGSLKPCNRGDCSFTCEHRPAARYGASHGLMTDAPALS